MKSIKLIIFILSIISQNCAVVRKTGTYTLNRIADLSDIVTVTVGANAYGAKGYIGPLEVGLHRDGIGGYQCVVEKRCSHGNFAIFNGLPSGEIGLRKGPAGWVNFGETAVVNLWEISMGYSRYGSNGVGIMKKSAEMWGDDFKASPEQYTRIGVTGGFLFNARIEINPGELADFLLGFLGIDIYGDDVIKIYPSYLTSMIESREPFEKIKEAIDNEGDPPDFTVDSRGSSLLHYAARRCNLKLVRYLVEEKRYNVNWRNPEYNYPGFSPLGTVNVFSHRKYENDSYDDACINTANYLENKGGSFLNDGRMRKFRRKMIEAIMKEDISYIKKYLSDVDKQRRFKIKGGEKFVCSEDPDREQDCIVYPDIREIKELPGKEDKKHYSSNFGGFTLLQAAVYYNKPNMVKSLLQLGADPKQKNFYGKDAFDLAKELSHTDLIEIMKGKVPALSEKQSEKK